MKYRREVFFRTSRSQRFGIIAALARDGQKSDHYSLKHVSEDNVPFVLLPFLVQ